MIIKRDFTFNKDRLVSYYDNLKQFHGTNISPGDITKQLQSEYPDNVYFHALDRKFATLKFYGFVYFNDNNEFMLNEHFEDYINCLIANQDASDCFLKIILSSNYKFYENSETNFFELLIGLIKDESVLYLDHIDIILYVQNFDQINDFDKLVDIIQSNRAINFIDRAKKLDLFYNEKVTEKERKLIAARVHEAGYLFTFLESNGFYIKQNSLQAKTYYQGNTPRHLTDKRLYLSKDMLEVINGYEYESIVDEIEYNSVLEGELYQDPGTDISKLVAKSEETEKTIIKRYKTDRKLRNNALENSGYLCEMAKLKGTEHKTFPSRIYDGDYVEVHHLIPMHAQENDLFVQEDKLISLDQISNLIVLCPTCHSKLHYGKSNDVRPELELLYEDRKAALSKNELNLEKEELLGFYNI